tara:strand:+ start:876 stop:1238 length:363 start_codon:yes stop_codon:yes gene_type:complete
MDTSKGFAPTAAMKSAARTGLRLRKKHKRGGLSTQEAGKQGIGSGVARAAAIASGQRLSYSTVKRMKSFFARHSAYKHKHKSDPTGAAKISWLLWGGSAGKVWSEAIVNRVEGAKKRSKQ